ncbi:nucleotidyltransferase domain-containing protein, partial [Patescibacteria group bacterium]|nr:nucleotidyltransferase domain-containing protein [Patescibacteria group bacterium]
INFLVMSVFRGDSKINTEMMYNMGMINTKKLIELFRQFPAVKLVYLFGSRAREEAGPLSDYDFAVWLEEADPAAAGKLKLELINKIGTALGTEQIDMVALNSCETPELKYDIITNGRLIYEIEPFKLIVEPKIINEYIDFDYLLKKYNLTIS